MTHEQSGTAFDPDARGHELMGRDTVATNMNAEITLCMLRLYLFPLPKGSNAIVNGYHRTALETFPGMMKEQVFNLMAKAVTRRELAVECKRQGLDRSFVELVVNFFQRNLKQDMAEKLLDWSAS